MEKKNCHDQSFYDLYSSSNINYVVTFRRMRWTECETNIGRREMCTGSCWGNLKERDHLEDLGIDEIILHSEDGRNLWVVCEHINGPLGFIKCGENYSSSTETVSFSRKTLQHEM